MSACDKSYAVQLTFKWLDHANASDRLIMKAFKYKAYFWAFNEMQRENDQT